MGVDVRTVAKAIAAGSSAFAGAVVTASTDGAVTGLEWAMVAATTIGAAAITWAVPNRPTPDGGTQ